MSESHPDFLQRLANPASSFEFDEVMAQIAAHYHYSPCRFSNGEGDAMAVNEAGTNEGSCKIFAFAQLHELSEQVTLSLFGKFYRDDVLLHPEANDHANIRNFMKTGWAGIAFDGQALRAK